MVVSLRYDLYTSLHILKKCSTMRWELKTKSHKAYSNFKYGLSWLQKRTLNFDLDELSLLKAKLKKRF